MTTTARQMCVVVRLLLIVAFSVSSVMPLPSDSRGRVARAAGASVDGLLTRCPSATEVAAINTRLTLAFEHDPTVGSLVCSTAAGSANLTLLQQRAYQALLVMQALEFDTPLPWTTKPLYDWFTGAVTGIRFRGDIAISFCCDPANTLNIQTQNLDALQTDRWLSPDHPSGMQGLVVLLAHEARHSEGFPHTCGSNDQTLQELGAWGVQYYLLLWLAEHSDPALLHPDPLFPGLGATYYRDQARNEASSTLQTRFCNLGPTGDQVPPTTNPVLTPAPNQAGWNRTDVTVTLTATDDTGGSGVKQVTFSATGAQPIASTTAPGATATVPPITAEGITTLTFFATDQAGNTESTRTLAIKIDKTPPEAMVRFDPAHHDLVALGRDAGSGISAAPIAPLSVTPVAQRRNGDDEDESDDHEREAGRRELRTYRIQDAAGNTLRLTLEVRATAHRLRAEVASLQYNAAAVVTPPQNQARFAWQLDQARHVRELKQTLRVGGERDRQAVQAEFRARDNRTRIEVKTPRPELELTRLGLVLLELVTTKGALRIAF